MNNRYKLGKMSDDEFWNWAAKEWSLDLSPNEFADLLVANYSVDPQVEEVVKLARQRGYKTLVCSNNFPARVNGLQKNLVFSIISMPPFFRTRWAPPSRRRRFLQS